jgi:hypothetical protein
MPADVIRLAVKAPSNKQAAAILRELADQLEADTGRVHAVVAAAVTDNGYYQAVEGSSALAIIGLATLLSVRITEEDD